MRIPTAMLIAMALGGQSQSISTYGMGRRERKPRHPFNEEELAKLETLEGKEKKKFVKELKLKYGSGA